ncbi:hypothetical protein NTGBS_40071 [Candidatus Nitrotoga sp. BS]|uniref:hypothetical protein n=1 Tax=Candidatus Nitrotoga sp. BS TaxID=2890408 RepID=UPI001EF19DE8|nr:hypothetical protein [Candidatus Nitrotoga sp. BS]CAH1199998.1 hypothetical protein NTGBS_40071 [Candidatus Nitrotoga sp. BS]
MLNQIMRPLKARWHKLALEDGLQDVQQCQQFRNDLSALQTQLKKYTGMLADMAGVEDLSELES